jgi:dihydroorotate dehydrogenase
MASHKPDLSATARSAAAGRLGFRFCGLPFASPIVLLSGCVGFGEEYTRIEGFSNQDVGAIVLKGTTGKPRLGNPPHRVYETAGGMLNAIGLQNPGVQQVGNTILPQLDFHRRYPNLSDHRGGVSRSRLDQSCGSMPSRSTSLPKREGSGIASATTRT